MTLHWRPPKDTGGEEITNYVVEKKDPKTGEWTKVSSVVMGTQFRVRNLKENQPYEFRVRAENSQGVSDPLESTEAFVAKSPFGVPGAPGAPTPLDTSEDSITLEWSRPYKDGGSPIQGYFVEKRIKGDGKWVKASYTMVLDTKLKVFMMVSSQSIMMHFYHS